MRCAIGLDAHTCHGLRHDFASLLVGAGVPNRVVMEMLGHTNIAMTSRYQHVADALQREAASHLDTLLSDTQTVRAATP